ncbi:hypothetical protein D9619_009142 [Psilocybe cf. subviscida]|uniref:Secreted protein n=1 Tax=Psilocybe cf. subviscida TaxID=2480587 RepID=A0A8H5BU36_9AGAR|nr:hypothetical protein D9619_009142 [Psilocybe cf. subviscida]
MFRSFQLFSLVILWIPGLKDDQKGGPSAACVRSTVMSVAEAVGLVERSLSVVFFSYSFFGIRA